MLLAAPVAAQTKVGFTCGSFTTEAWRTESTSHWTIIRGEEKTTETAVLKKGPRFSCVAGAVLAIDFVSASGQSFLGLRAPDGTTFSYRGQTFEKNGRFVLPIQARPRLPAEYRTAFDYHCRLQIPDDPIPPSAKAECVP